MLLSPPLEEYPQEALDSYNQSVENALKSFNPSKLPPSTPRNPPLTLMKRLLDRCEDIFRATTTLRVPVEPELAQANISVFVALALNTPRLFPDQFDKRWGDLNAYLSSLQSAGQSQQIPKELQSAGQSQQIPKEYCASLHLALHKNRFLNPPPVLTETLGLLEHLAAASSDTTEAEWTNPYPLPDHTFYDIHNSNTSYNRTAAFASSVCYLDKYAYSLPIPPSLSCLSEDSFAKQNPSLYNQEDELLRESFYPPLPPDWATIQIVGDHHLARVVCLSNLEANDSPSSLLRNPHFICIRCCLRFEHPSSAASQPCNADCVTQPLNDSYEAVNRQLLTLSLQTSIIRYFIEHGMPPSPPAPGFHTSASASSHSPSDTPQEECITASSIHSSFVYQGNSLEVFDWKTGTLSRIRPQQTTVKPPAPELSKLRHREVEEEVEDGEEEDGTGNGEEGEDGEEEDGRGNGEGEGEDGEEEDGKGNGEGEGEDGEDAEGNEEGEGDQPCMGRGEEGTDQQTKANPNATVSSPDISGRSKTTIYREANKLSSTNKDTLQSCVEQAIRQRSGAIQHMPLPAVTPVPSPYWLQNSTAIRFHSDSLPHPLSHYFTCVRTLADRRNYEDLVSTVDENTVITPALSAFLQAALHNRPERDLLCITEFLLKFPPTPLNLHISPDAVFVTPSAFVETTHPSWDGLAPYQITLVGENKTDKAIKEPQSLAQIISYHLPILECQPGRSFIFGYLFSPSYIQIILTARNPIVKGNDHTYDVYVSDYLPTFEGGLLYLYEFLNQPLEFFGLRTISHPPTGSVSVRVHHPQEHLSVRIGRTAYVYDQFIAGTWLPPPPHDLSTQLSIQPKAVKCFRRPYAPLISLEVLLPYIVSFYAPAPGIPESFSAIPSAAISFHYNPPPVLTEPILRTLPTALSFRFLQIAFPYQGFPLCSVSGFGTSIPVKATADLFKHLLLLHKFRICHRDISLSNLLFFSPTRLQRLLQLRADKRFDPTQYNRILSDVHYYNGDRIIVIDLGTAVGTHSRASFFGTVTFSSASILDCYRDQEEPVDTIKPLFFSSDDLISALKVVGVLALSESQRDNFFKHSVSHATFEQQVQSAQSLWMTYKVEDRLELFGFPFLLDHPNLILGTTIASFSDLKSEHVSELLFSNEDDAFHFALDLRYGSASFPLPPSDSPPPSYLHCIPQPLWSTFKLDCVLPEHLHHFSLFTKSGSPSSLEASPQSPTSASYLTTEISGLCCYVGGTPPLTFSKPQTSTIASYLPLIFLIRPSLEQKLHSILELISAQDPLQIGRDKEVVKAALNTVAHFTAASNSSSSSSTDIRPTLLPVPVAQFVRVIYPSVSASCPHHTVYSYRSFNWISADALEETKQTELQRIRAEAAEDRQKYQNFLTLEFLTYLSIRTGNVPQNSLVKLIQVFPEVELRLLKLYAEDTVERNKFFDSLVSSV